MKNKLNFQLLEAYQATIFRKLKWYAHINKKRSTTKLIRKIKKTFGKGAIMIMGDWSDKKSNSAPIKYISTPNKWLKDKLAEHMTIYNIDEHRTSCLHYRTEQRCDNLWLKNQNNKGRKNEHVQYKIHSVLTSQMENGRFGYINRDNNASNNMIKLTRAFLSGQPRPERYCRGIRLPEDDLQTMDNLLPNIQLPALEGSIMETPVL
jgi:hypothetical protein